MPAYVTHGAMLRCSQGLAPSSLNVLPLSAVTIEGVTVATINDFAPSVNVPPFGMCMSPANPQVAAATAAAMGVLTPQPCVPVISAPWTPGATVGTAEGVALLTADCQCMCAWAGAISIVQAAQIFVEGE
ncbi:MAG: DUF4280 domain-containing protein [Polyangiales bacterium]